MNTNNISLVEGIEQAAAALGVSSIDLATAISYETAGTFDPTKRGPTTQHGQHRGLIQFGEPQAIQYGVDWNDPLGSQLGSDGAIVRYLQDTGVQPGMGLMDIYSAINAGGVGRNNRSDASNGGAPGTVADKVNNQMTGHLANAERLFGSDHITTSTLPPAGAEQAPTGAQSNLPEGLVVPHANPAPSYLSRRDEQRAQGGGVGFFEGAGEAISSEWAGSFALAQMGAEDFTPDTEFRFNEELWGELTEGLPTDYHEMFDDAVSEAHARALRTRADEMVETDNKLSSMGGTGTALRIGAAVLDPVAIGASILTEGVAAPMIWGAKLTRTGRALRAGVSAGAVNAATEGYIASQDPTRGATDILLAGATGLAVGGALGAFIPTKGDIALERAARGLQRELVTQSGDVRSMGAAFVGSGDAPIMSAAERQLMQTEGDAPRSAFAKARIDMVGVLKGSEHPIVRRLAGYLAEDGVGNADGSVLARSASENVSLAMRTRMSSFYRSVEPAFASWVKSQGIPMWKRGAYREEFFDEVGAAVRRKAGFYTDNVEINKAADAMRSAQKDLLAFAKEKGLKGFDKVAEDGEYLMRVFNHKRLDELTEKFGDGFMKRMIGNSLVKGSDDLDYEDALSIANAYLKSIRSQKYQDVQLSRVFSEDQADLLESILKDEGTISADRIASITSTVRKQQGGEGQINRAKRRLRLDETHKETFIGADKVAHKVGLEDFLDNNAERLMNQYTRQIAGAGFMEEALSNFKVTRLDGGVDEYAPNFDTILSHIRETAGEFDMKPVQLDAEIKKLETLYKAVMGIPLRKADKPAVALRMLRDYNFIRVMNQVGFAQIAEIGNILGHTGIKATMQHVPAFKKIWKRAANGSMDDDLLDEIEVIWGLGTDRLRQTATNRMDDYGIFEGKATGKLEAGLEKGKQITADASLMAPVNMALQRMAGRAAVQRFMNMAVDGKTMSKSRMASMGLSDEMGARIKAEMLDHVDVQQGMLGRNVKRLNIDEWADQDAASAFVNAIDRWSKKIIQENDIGQMSQWMTTDLGKSFIQFRSFMTAAWTKQALTGMHHRDWQTFVAWSTSIFFGGLSYTAQTYINSVGRDDQQEYLSKRLSAGALGRSAFQRAGFATIIPGATDAVMFYTGFEPVFAYGRSTGLSSGTLTSNPTFDLMDKSASAVRGGLASMRGDYKYSQQDFRALTSVGPFQNAMGLRNIYNMMSQRLPRYSQ